MFDTESGMFYRHTPSAGLVLKALEEGRSQNEIVALLSERFSIDPARARRDVELLVNDLSSLQALYRVRS